MILQLLPLVLAMSGQSPPPPLAQAPPQQATPAVVVARPPQAPRKLYNDAAAVSYTHLTLPTIYSV